LYPHFSVLELLLAFAAAQIERPAWFFGSVTRQK
jgi:hypothetical protein